MNPLQELLKFPDFVRSLSREISLFVEVSRDIVELGLGRVARFGSGVLKEPLAFGCRDKFPGAQANRGAAAGVFDQMIAPGF